MQLFRGKKKIESLVFSEMIFSQRQVYAPFPAEGSPDFRVALGDYGSIDKYTGKFKRDGNLLDLCKPEIENAIQSILENPVELKGETDTVACYSGDDTGFSKMIDMTKASQLAKANPRGGWSYDNDRFAALIIICPMSSTIRSEFKLRHFLKTTGVLNSLNTSKSTKETVAVVTSIVHSEAYAAFISNGKKGEVSWGFQNDIVNSNGTPWITIGEGTWRTGQSDDGAGVVVATLRSLEQPADDKIVLPFDIASSSWVYSNVMFNDSTSEGHFAPFQPSIVLKIGDYGHVDKRSGQLVRSGNILAELGLIGDNISTPPLDIPEYRQVSFDPKISSIKKTSSNNDGDPIVPGSQHVWEYSAGIHAVIIMVGVVHEKLGKDTEDKISNSLLSRCKDSPELRSISIVTERFYSDSYASLLTGGSPGKASIEFHGDVDDTSKTRMTWSTSADGGTWSTGVYTQDKKRYTPLCVLRTLRLHPEEVFSRPFDFSYELAPTTPLSSIHEGTSVGSTTIGETAALVTTQQAVTLSTSAVILRQPTYNNANRRAEAESDQSQRPPINQTPSQPNTQLISDIPQATDRQASVGTETAQEQQFASDDVTGAPAMTDTWYPATSQLNPTVPFPAASEGVDAEISPTELVDEPGLILQLQSSDAAPPPLSANSSDETDTTLTAGNASTCTAIAGGADAADAVEGPDITQARRGLTVPLLPDGLEDEMYYAANQYPEDDIGGEEQPSTPGEVASTQNEEHGETLSQTT